MWHLSHGMLPISSPKTTVGTNNRRDEEDASSVGKKHATLVSFFRSLLCRIGVVDYRKIIHSIKVGIALVLVSLLSTLQPLNDPVGDNAMWAVMTVVVVFEFTAGKKQGEGVGCFGPSWTPMSGGASRAPKLIRFFIPRENF